MTQTADDLRAQAAQHERSAQESFDRCDTDGFLSQWADGITAQQLRRQAEIEDNGGVWEFDTLTDLDGNEIPNRVISTQYGACYAVTDETGKFTGTFVPLRFTERSKHYKAGYRMGKVTAPAKAEIGAPKGACGLSGAASAYVYIKRVG